MDDPTPGPATAETHPPEGRRWPIVLATVVVVLAVAAGAGWYAYDRASAPAPGEVPLIRADSAPIKRKPDDPGGLKVPYRDKLVYAIIGDDGEPQRAERLLPPPEEPLPPLVVEEAPAESAPEKPLAAAEATPEAPVPSVAPVEPAPISAEPSVAATQAASVPAPPPAKPATKPETKTVASLAPAAPAAGGYLVQLAAFKSAGEATKAWARVLKGNRDLLGALKPTVIKADLGASGVFYRLRVGPFAVAEAAAALCAKLKRRKLDCLVVAR